MSDRTGGLGFGTVRSLTSQQSTGGWTRWFFRRSAAAAIEFAGDLTVPGRRTPKMARLEAVLLVAEGALSTRKLAQLATLADAAEARRLADELNDLFDQSGSAFRIERVAAGYQLMTRPEFSFWLNKLHHRQAELKLTPPALETLTIVAYRQPITRADVEAVRGVQCTEMLKYLMERGLVRIGGEDDSLGRPYLYETTRTFLELFGLRNLDDLPMAEQLRETKTQPAESEQEPDLVDDPGEEDRTDECGEAPASDGADDNSPDTVPFSDDGSNAAA